MALQGDLNSFALPEVLRLLAGTGKSGRLEVVGDGTAGDLILSDGRLHGGGVASAPNATESADVLYELLRFEEGAFTFDEGDHDVDGEGADVEDVISAAEALVAEWVDVETVVPSMQAWITLTPELAGEHAVVTSDQWRLVAAIGSGGSVRDLADGLELTDLAACRAVKDLAAAELVLVRASHGYEPPSTPDPRHDDLTTFADEVDAIADPMTDLEDLVVEDRPVVMEDSDDALLPEPLPGEAVAFEGEVIVGFVDGHTFDHHDEAGLVDGPPAPALDDLGRYEDFDATTGPELAHAAIGDGDPEAGGVAPFSEVGRDDAYDSAIFADAAPAAPAPAPALEDRSPELTAPADLQPSDFGTVEGTDDPDDDERGSLLRFLSTVKP